MSVLIRTAALMLLMAPATLAAQQPAPAPPPAAPAPAAQYSTASTTIGALIDNPATRAVLVRHLPGIIENPNVEQARPLTLRMAQSYAPEMLPTALLDLIDQDLAALPVEPPAPPPAG